MNEAVELILKRMDSHPEEWVDEWATSDMAPKNRWQNVVYQVRSRMQEAGRCLVSDGELRAQNPGPYPGLLPFLTDDECEAIYLKHVELQKEAFTKFVIATVCGIGQPETYAPDYELAPGTGTLSGAISNYAQAKARVFGGGVG